MKITVHLPSDKNKKDELEKRVAEVNKETVDK